MKRNLTYPVLICIGLLKIAVWLLRYVVFGMLMFIRPLTSLVFGVASALCLFGLVAGLIIARDHTQMLWAFLAAGLVSTVILFCYDALLLTVAPSSFPLLLAR